MNLEKYDTLLDLFDKYSGTDTLITLYWENGNSLECLSQELAETDSDIPEESDEYPGYYSIFLRIKDVISWKIDDSSYLPTTDSIWEIDKLTAPMLVKVDDEIVWEKEEVK